MRIALYFNSELDEIEHIIDGSFIITKKKVFPAEGKGYGYTTTHYRGQIKESVLTDEQKRFVSANIEIQVASLLMHAWSEVEHDIVYKPLQGKVSKDEQEALNELNQTVLQGEKILEKLHNFLMQYATDTL